jgi:hypothetical protein
MGHVIARVAAISRVAGLDSTLGAPESLLHVQRFVRTQGVSGTALASQLAECIPRMEGFLATMSWRDLAERVAEIVRPRRQEVVASWDCPLRVAALPLYCPVAEGALASMRIKASVEQATSFKIDIFGVGGSDELSVEIAVSDTVQVASEDVLLNVVVPASWELVRSTGIEGDVCEFPRLAAVARDAIEFSVVRLLNPKVDPAWGAEILTTDIDLREVSGSLVRTVQAKRSSRVNGNARIPLPGGVVGFETGYTVVLQSEIEYTYTLPGGTMYRAHQYQNAFHWYWR